MNSAIILCKGIKLDRDYRNVLSYSESQLLATCRDNRYRIAEASNYSFIGRDNRIIVNFTWGQCIKANYIAFQNPNYNNKWFFAFIDNVVYKSDEATEIDFTIDAWSTWFNDWQKKPCYIVREHVNNDGIGQNTIPENLDVGLVEAINNVEETALGIDYGYYIVCASTWNIGDNQTQASQQVGSVCYNGMIFAEKIYLFQTVNRNGLIQALVNLQLFLMQTSSDGHIADVKNVYIVPDYCINAAELQQHVKTVGGYDCTYYVLPNSVNIPQSELNATFSNYNTYKPKNNKCYCYPYHYLFATNNNGANNIYKYENFDDPKNPKFAISCVIMPGCSGRLYPKFYKGQGTNVDESLPLGKYPICEWSCDAYINWLTQNAVNIPTNFALSLGGGASTMIPMSGSTLANGPENNTRGQNIVNNIGGAVGAGTSIAGGIANTIGAFYSVSLLPSITGGQNTADVNFVNGLNTFVIYEMKCKDEYLKIIDDYFTRFGYKINRVLEPNIVGRRNWNYLEIASSETVGNGDVPTTYMNEINNACRRGVTIWHKHDNIGNYNLDNSIV